MPRSRSATAQGALPSCEATEPRRFWLYLEGPRDHEVLRGWARSCAPPLQRVIERSAVLLGGRRPDRAADHFRRMGGPAGGHRGLCVLDRDRESPGRHTDTDQGLDGLRVFTWTRRHIESYLLSPDAIRRGLGLPRNDGRVDRILREGLPDSSDEETLRRVDAKRLLGRGGALARGLGRPVSPGRVARAMRATEIHEDVHRLFDEVRDGLGLPGFRPSL